MSTTNAITISPWKKHSTHEKVKVTDEEIRKYIDNLPPNKKDTQHGNPMFYKFAKIPSNEDPNWKLWIPGNDGKYSFTLESKIEPFKELDFCYMQTDVYIPADCKPKTTIKVSFETVDDGVRVYVFNSDHPYTPDPTILTDESKKCFYSQADLKLGDKSDVTKAQNLYGLFKKGETNRVVVVQFDDAGGGNNLKDLQINVDEAPVPVSKKPYVHPLQINVRPASEIKQVGFDTRDNPGVFEYKNIPPIQDPNWQDWKPNSDGVYGYEGETKPGAPSQGGFIDFTYVQCTVDIPKDCVVNNFRVSINKVDDGARVYIFNSRHPEGAYKPEADVYYDWYQPNHIKHGATDDFKDLVATGEINRVVIVQYDGHTSENVLMGVSIIVD